MAPDRIKLIEYELYSKDQRFNTSKTVEATILLDLVKTITSKAYKISEGRIIIAIDNKKIWQISYREIVVANYFN